MNYSKKTQTKNPRNGANLISQLLFLWIIPLLSKGKNGFNADELPRNLNKDSSSDLGDILEREWKNELKKSDKNNNKNILRNAMFKVFFPNLILDGILVALYVLSRTLLPFVLAKLLKQLQTINAGQHTTIKLQFSEINSSNIHLLSDTDNKTNIDNSSNYNIENLNLLNNYSNPNLNISQNYTIISERYESNFEYISTNVYWLATQLVLLSLFSALFDHHSDLRQRLVGARMKIACSSLIYRKTLRLSKKSTREIGAGYLVNLLSNDVSRFDYGFIYAHYLWVLPFQTCLICYLIWQQVGIASVVAVLALLCQTVPAHTILSYISSILRKKIAVRTDERVGIMYEIIQGIQVIKMYAWEKPFNAIVATIRKREVRQIKFGCYIRGFYLSTITYTERSSLFITILAITLLGQNISSDIVFSLAQFFESLQLIAGMFYPLALSFGAEALVSINRIQDYLLMEEKCNESEIAGITHMKSNANSSNENAIEIMNVSASWNDEVLKSQLTLTDISLNVKDGQLCAIIGTVGAGKSSLLNILMGEIPIRNGKCLIKGDISYAAQEPWLFSESVRNNILFGEIYNKHRYDKVIKCCSLKTDLEQLPQGDRTLVGERGTSLSGGQRARISLARAIYKSAQIYLLDDPLSAVDTHVGKHLFEEVIGSQGFLAMENTTRILVTHQVHFLKSADVIIVMENGRIIQKGTYNDLIDGKIDFEKSLQKNWNSIDKKSETEDYDIITSELHDESNFVPCIVGQSFRKRRLSVRSSKRSMQFEEKTYNSNKEEQETGIVALKVWTDYFQYGGNICILSAMIIIIILSQTFISGSDYFLKFWTQEEYNRENSQPTTFTNYENLSIYGALIFAVILFCILRCHLFFKICMQASKKLHNTMFARLLNAPMRFFDKISSGQILNRFSKDMGAVDELLPQAMMEFLDIFLIMIGILTMILIVNPLLITALTCSLILYACIFKLYLRPSQDLKRLEGITSSPVFSHLSASLNGISTIRAKNFENNLAREFDSLQDVHSAIWQLTLSANTVLGLWLDFISVMFVACVTFSFIVINKNTFSGDAGLAISQSLTLTGMVQYGIRQTAEAMQQMTSVERILQYTNLEQEEKHIDKLPSEKWPENGKIQFKNMSLRYDPNDAATLQNLHIQIESKWKVGIVGRTGAGKSSLINALFRLSIIEGEILIDGLDTGSISLDSLRSKLSIIPQDPVLFSASIRYNLDPFKLFNDDVLWKSLEDVELKQSVNSLDYMVTESGSNFSVGQRQLICLARAILRNNKILILDEATANVDPQTDALIQRTIRNKFEQCTVLTIAHRLHTVMDSDRILVMDAGHASEFDIPHLLLQQKNGVLRNMVEATGPQESEYLKKIALDKYEELKKT